MKRLYLIIILLFIHVNNLSQELLYDISRFDYLFAEGENVTYAATVGELLIMQVMKNKCDQYCGNYYQPHYSIGLFDLSNSSVPKEVGRVYKNIFRGETKYAESFIYVDSSALHYPYYKFYFEDSQETPVYIWSPNLVIRKDSLIFEFFHYSDELNVCKINGNGETEYLNTHILQAKLGWVTGYGVKEDYFYITNRAPSGLVIVDVSNVNQINEITHSISNKDLTGLITGKDKVIIGEAFDKIHILDVTDPTNPHSISSPFFQHGLLTGAYKEEFFYLSGGRNFSSLNEISLDMKTIEAQGYISEITMGKNSIILSTNLGFEIFDDSEPENPQKLSNCGANIAKPIQFIKRDSLIYVCNGGDGLSILNAADSSNIKLVSSLDYEGFAVDLVLDSTFIYIADYLKGLIIINVNNPSSPFIESEFFIHNGPASLTKLNNYVFIICDDNKLYALDISNISIPQIVYEKQFPSNGGMHWGDYKKVISANNIIWIQLTSLPLLAFHFSEESGFTEIFKYESYFSFDPREFNVIDSLLFYTHINGIQIINLNSNTIINENGFGFDHMEESPIGIAYNYDNNILYASMIVFGISGIKAYDLSELKNPIRIPGYFPLGFAPNQIFWQNGLLYFLTPSGIGIASEDEVSSVHDIDNDLDPNEFHLSQNYPNPFNPTTKIKFSLTRPSVTLSYWERDGVRVSLKIYDLLGREMATLINESKPPGTYEVEFDGSQLPSGVYFYKLNAGKYSETKKMVLMR